MSSQTGLIDVNLKFRAGVTDKTYLSTLRERLPTVIDATQPQLIVYNAGTDCLIGDPLGVMDISAEGIVARDELVMELALTRRIPILYLLSGGYQKSNARVIADSIKNLNQKFHLIDNILRPAVQSEEAKSPLP
eukprot:TRINITY_DN651_c0_g1_i11.p1 TRINITY_DN651_c0_g1~~TRINITY_DN651_c0_g1_i11.p1  ORF type:complete len:134 (-),score=9.14 TRINITY_DN651_c0_g1_i11:161-562(-)